MHWGRGSSGGTKLSVGTGESVCAHAPSAPAQGSWDDRSKLAPEGRSWGSFVLRSVSLLSLLQVNWPCGTSWSAKLPLLLPQCMMTQLLTLGDLSLSLSLTVALSFSGEPCPAGHVERARLPHLLPQ
jgi:hypothetical protein